MTVEELKALGERIDRVLGNVLGDLDRTRDHEAVADGFNKAWDVVRDILKEEIQRKGA